MSYIQVDYVAHVKDAETVMQRAKNGHRLSILSWFTITLLNIPNYTSLYLANCFNFSLHLNYLSSVP